MRQVFLRMLHDGGWPVNVISRLVDPGRAACSGWAIVMRAAQIGEFLRWR
jgi:hypothetical protein